MISWDNGRTLSLIPGVDKIHVVGCSPDESRDDVEREAELDKSFE